MPQFHRIHPLGPQPHLHTSPEILSPRPPRDVISWHVRPDGTYRAVIVRWHRTRHETLNTIHRAYTARTVMALWNLLWLYGHIPSDTYHCHDAYRAFVMLGRAHDRDHYPIRT